MNSTLCDIMAVLNHSWYELIKDFVVPIIGSALGILGAFFVLKHQLKKQRQIELEKSNNQSASIRKVYQINITSLISELDKIYDSLEDEYERILDEGCDFMPSINSCRPQSLKLLLGLNYESHFKAHLEVGQNQTENFNLSYKSLIRFDDLISSVNYGLERYSKAFSNTLQENRQLLNSFLGREVVIYDDVKKIIRNQYKALDDQLETVTFQRNIFKAVLKSQYLHNPHVDFEIIERFIEECNSSLHKIMVLSVESDKLKNIFGDFINEFEKLKANLNSILKGKLV